MPALLRKAWLLLRNQLPGHMLRLPLKVKGSENPSQTRFQKQVRESFAENIDSFSPNETVLVQTLFPNHPFIQMNASNFVVKISLPKTKLNKFLKSAKSMLSLLGKARIRHLDPSCLRKLLLQQKEQVQIFVNPNLWSPEEIKNMPEKAIATWYRLSLRQLQIGEFLQQLRQVRMMNLIKLNSKQTLTWCRWYQASKCHVSLLAYLGRPALSCKEWIHSYAEISCQTASSEDVMNELRTLDSLPLYIGLKLMTAWCTCHRCVFGADWLAPWAH